MEKNYPKDPSVPKGMHRMPNGSLMKDSDMDKKRPGALKRLAKMKAEKKMSKESKMSKRANKFELNDGFNPTMNKALGLTKKRKKK